MNSIRHQVERNSSYPNRAFQDIANAGHQQIRFFFCLVLLALLVFASNLSRAQPSPKEIARQILPAVVTIYTFDADGKARGLGSGFVVHAGGYVVTNSHVIEEADQAGVLFGDGRKARVLGVVSADPDKDYALIQIEATGLPMAPIAGFDEPEVGERVLALGAPLGLRGTVSEGIVSQVRDVNQRNGRGERRMIQHTAAISPGSSGGPLVNERGRVIGINSEIQTQGQSLNFALPLLHLREAFAKPLDGYATLSEYKAYVAKREEKRVEEAIRQAFKLYQEPDGLFSVLMPRNWNVQRQVSAIAETGGSEVIIVLHAPEAEQARIDGWVSAGIRFTIRIPPKGREWSATYIETWVKSTVQNLLSSYDKFDTGKPYKVELAGQKATVVRVQGSSDQISEAELSSIYVMANPRVQMLIEVAMPASESKAWALLNSILAGSLKTAW